MALTYIDFYHAIHLLVHSGRRSPRGKKYTNAYWLRANEKDPNTIELIQYHWSSFVVNPDAPRSDRQIESLEPKYRPYCVIGSFTREGFTITNQHQYQKTHHIFPQAALDKYKDKQLETYDYGPHHSVDSTLNNFLRRMTPRLYQEGNGVRGKPGIVWHGVGTPQNIEGPVKYDAATHTLTPMWRQREKKVKTEERRRITKALSHAFKRLKILTTMGVTVTRAEIEATRSERFGKDNTQRQDVHAFLEAAATFDPQNHEDTLNIIAWAETIHGHRESTWHKPRHPLLEKSGLETFRRRIHKQMNVVTYE